MGISPIQAEQVAPAGFVSISGKDFIDAEGKPFLLRGVSLGDWLVPEGYLLRIGEDNSPRTINEVVSEMVGESEANDFWRTYRENYITRDDIQCIKRSGFNSIRIPFDYRLFVREGPSSDGAPPVFEGPGYALLDRVVGWCKEAKLYVILDMHAAPGGQTGYNIDNSWGYPFLYESAPCQDLTVAIWTNLAARYSSESTVLGYDLLNEPIADFHNSAQLNAQLEPLYKRIVAGIRTKDTFHICFLGGAQWDTNFAVFGPPFDPRLAYTFHLYLADPVKPTIQRFLDFRDKYNVPLWLGESGETTNEWTTRFRTLLEQNQVGWCFWPYKKLEVPTSHDKVHPYGSCVVTVTPPKDWSIVTKFAALPRTTWGQIRTTRPSTETGRELLKQLLENIQFKNCKVNAGYISALGLKSETTANDTAADILTEKPGP